MGAGASSSEKLTNSLKSASCSVHTQDTAVSWKSVQTEAETHFHRGNFIQAEELYLVCLHECKSQFSENDEVFIALQSALAIVYGQQGQHDEAVNLLNQVYKTHVTLFGERHAKSLLALHHLAMAYCQAGQHVVGESMLKTCLDLREEVCGEAHFETLETLHCLALNWAEQGHIDKAERLISQRLETLRAEAPFNASALEGMLVLCGLYEAQGKLLQAKLLCHECAEYVHGLRAEGHPLFPPLAEQITSMKERLDGEDEKEVLLYHLSARR